MSFTYRKEEKEPSSEFSRFIREAKSREKKKVYKRVIEEAIKEQKDLVAKTG